MAWCSWKGLIAVVAALSLGCTAPGIRPIQPPRDNLARQDAIGDCARLYRQVDAAVAAAGVQDAQSTRLPGLPYLRINRFLAAVAPAPDAAAFSGWVDRLRQLDRQARQAEIANLPSGVAPADWPERLRQCAGVLRRHDLASDTVRAELARAAPPDDYRPALRVLGLYPLTSIPFMQGVLRLHRETRETFATPLAELTVTGKLRRIAPGQPGPAPTAAAVAQLLARASDNPLGIPEPSTRELEALLRTFAPIWEIDTATPADRPGHPAVRAAGPPQVLGEPAVFTHTSYTRWQGRTLLQLNYVIWFPARPREGTFDLVAGHFDGINWRVTVGPDGRPLLYDAMHNCGCYYKAFPTPRLELTERRHGWEEPISVPQNVPDGPGRLVLRVSAGSHYLQRIYHDTGTPADDVYALEDYDRLRSLPLTAGTAQDGPEKSAASRRSLFGPEGIVPGTRRPERWVFWPMGVPSPGAMRQWGNHAIAFVGRRHFDDPHLLERHFSPRE